MLKIICKFYHLPILDPSHELIISITCGSSSYNVTACHISLKYTTVLSSDFDYFYKSIAKNGSVILSTPDWIIRNGVVSLLYYFYIPSIMSSTTLTEPGITRSLYKYGSAKIRSVWLNFVIDVNTWFVNFTVGNQDPMNLPIFFMKGCDYLFSLNAGDKNIMPSYLSGCLMASLKQTAPPMLKPEIKTFFFYFC